MSADGWTGGPRCGGKSREREVDEYTKSGLIVKTGRRVTQTEWTCPSPNSATCGCPGCVVEYRLPGHPLYVRDADDEFDGTYATVYFKVPEAAKELVSGLVAKETPNERWLTTLKALEEGKRPDVVAKLRPVVEAIAATLANPAPAV
jgi:hypothetical protein